MLKDPKKRRAYDKLRNQDPKRKQANRERVARWKRENPEAMKKSRQIYMLKWRYGLTPEQYKKMYDSQGGKCAIRACIRPAEYIDHSHVTDEVRALLCKQCNFALGLVNDNTAMLHDLIEYLTRFQHGSD